MMESLKPFWIYWGVLLLGCILFLICPILFIVVLPVIFIIVPLWLGVVYMVGNAVQKRSEFNKTGKRIALSVLCTFLTVMIFPVCSWICDVVKWNDFQIGSFINNFKDITFWIAALIHFLFFWIGEETGRVRDKEVGNFT